MSFGVGRQPGDYDRAEAERRSLIDAHVVGNRVRSIVVRCRRFHFRLHISAATVLFAHAIPARFNGHASAISPDFNFTLFASVIDDRTLFPLHPTPFQRYTAPGLTGTYTGICSGSFLFGFPVRRTSGGPSLARRKPFCKKVGRICSVKNMSIEVRENGFPSNSGSCCRTVCEELSDGSLNSTVAMRSASALMWNSCTLPSPTGLPATWCSTAACRPWVTRNCPTASAAWSTTAPASGSVPS